MLIIILFYFFVDFTQEIAVKQLDRNGFQGNREFLVEVLMLSLLHHPNLVSLVGYCCDGDQRVLVYEYMPYGSLEDHLLGMYLSLSLSLDFSIYVKLLLTYSKKIETCHMCVLFFRIK